MPTSVQDFKGKWTITEMDQWEVEPDWFIEFDGEGSGSLSFACVDVELDQRMNNDTSNNKRSEFTFYGNDEDEEVFGRGWVEISGDHLSGYIHFHQGEESGFKASKSKKA